MNTVGILTFHESPNYGAILQAYALQTALHQLGYLPEIIDYRNPCRGILALSFYRRVRHLIWQKISNRISSTLLRQHRTDKFRNEFLRTSKIQYISNESLHLNPPQYDAYIAGSDQVWNPINNNHDSSYFLTFAPPDRLRISYAASFGISEIPVDCIDDYRHWLNQFHSLSCREKEGRKIISKLTGRNAELVLDPTLLIDKPIWDKLSSQHMFNTPYVLSYYIPGDSVVTRTINAISHKLTSMTKYLNVSIGLKEYHRFSPFGFSVFDAGPSQFIGLIQNSSFIVTNSFHGSVFAIIYEKPFIVVVNPRLPIQKALSSRIFNLLQLFHLQKHIIYTDNTNCSLSSFSFDTYKINSILIEQRQQSLAFLHKALIG